MTELLNLGELYVSDFLKPDEQPRCGKHELKLYLDEYGTARLGGQPPLDTMWGKYWYRSGINATMRKALADIVDSICSIREVGAGHLWLDIASNDGTLLSFVPQGAIKVGIDPADDSFKKEAEVYADLIIQDYFSADAYLKSKVGSLKADIVTSIAMFYDVENRDKFLDDVYQVMDDNGLWVLQLSYTPLMLEQNAFDNICHEHVYYYSLFNLRRLFRDHGFKIMDCQLNDVNGGSFRVYAMKNVGDESLFGTQPYRDICHFRVHSLLTYEERLDLDSPYVWRGFSGDVDELRETTTTFIKSAVKKGKTVMGYGASTKGNTLLQYFGLDNTLIAAIAERSPAKYGLRTVGTNIPIISEEEMREAHPDYLLVLPWHFISEFKKREADYLQKGGHFIVPCPKFEII
jgi:hypothetical protein